MVEHGEAFYEKLLFTRAESALKIHGILSVVFGSLGVLAGFLILVLSSISSAFDTSYDEYGSSIGLVFMSALVIVFWILPHAYLIASGIYLTRRPTPRLARTLVIINLVIGVFYNLILLIFAIINLTQINDYERGFHAHKKTHHES